MNYSGKTREIGGNSIDTVSLRRKKLESSEMTLIAEALKTNKSITTLNVKDNKIGHEGARKIAEMLKANQTVTTLHFDHNEIGEFGMRCLLEALMENQSITTLSFKCNQIKDSGARCIAVALKKKYIKKLYLSCNLIGDCGAKQIAESLKFNQSLTILDLASNEIGDPGAKSIAEAIASNNSIVELYLECNQIGDNGAKGIAIALTKNCRIKKLTIYKNPISETLINDIEKCLKNNTMHAEKDNAFSSETNELSKIVEISKLKASYETQNQQFIPEIKLFEIHNMTKRFNDKNLDDIFIKISNLILGGRDKLQEHSNKGILLLGNTGAGKSTLANLFSGKKLQAITDGEANDLVIDTVKSNEDIVIGHKLASETRIPNKCIVENVNIWDCPGFNDTDTVQEIVNIFYIKRLFQTTDKLKFVLIISELLLNTANARGTNFLEALSDFIKCFNDIERMKKNIFLVVTHVPQNKSIKHIKTAIDYILNSNQDTTPKQKILINNLKEDKSIYLFYKPRKEGELPEQNLLAPSNFLETIFKSHKYYTVQDDMVIKAISSRAKNCSLYFLNTASDNFNQLLEVIIYAISNPVQCINNAYNPFLKKHDLIENLRCTSFQYKDLPQNEKEEYFFEYDLLLNMQEVLSGSSNSVSNAVKTFEKAVELFAGYTEPGYQHKVQDFGYCLQQQYELVEFFANICNKEIPNHTKIKELITICHRNVTKYLQYHLMSLSIDKNQTNKNYYLKAIQYLEKYQDSKNCQEQKAIAYSCLGTIAETNEDEKLALDYYRKAIDANGHSPELCIKLGQLFFKEGQFAEAIDFYKVVNNDYKIKECFEAWLKQDQENPYIMLKQAEFFESIGLFERAKEHYLFACSLSPDENFKAVILNKISNITNNGVDKW